MKNEIIKKVQDAADKVVETAEKQFDKAKAYVDFKKEIIKTELELVAEKENLDKCFIAYGKIYFYGQSEPGEAEIVKEEITSIEENIKALEAKLVELKEAEAAKVEEKEAAKVTAFCTKCGTKRKGKDAYCGKCGKKY